MFTPLGNGDALRREAQAQVGFLMDADDLTAAEAADRLDLDEYQAELYETECLMNGHSVPNLHECGLGSEGSARAKRAQGLPLTANEASLLTEQDLHVGGSAGLSDPWVASLAMLNWR